MQTNGRPQFTTKRIKVNPKEVVRITKQFLAKNKNSKDFDKFLSIYQRRNDDPISEGFVESIRIMGKLIQTPILTKIGTTYYAVDGNKRFQATSQLAWKEIEADYMAYHPDLILDIKAMANEQRHEVSFLDRMANIMSFLRLDDKGKPQGLSFEETGKRFLNPATGKSYHHQTIRNIAQLALFAPEWLKTAIQDNDISYTEAQKLVAASVTENKKTKQVSLNEEKLLAAYEKWQSTATTSGSGRRLQDQTGEGATRQTSAQGKSKKVADKKLKFWGYSDLTPTVFRILIQYFLGDITLEQAIEQSKDAKGNPILGFLLNEPEKKAKKSKKAKADEEEEVTEEELEEIEEEEEEIEEEEEEGEYEEEEEEEEGDVEYEEEDEEEEYEEEEEEEEEEVKPRRRR